MIYKTDKGKELTLNFYRDILDKWPVEKSTHYVETNWGKTHVIKSGTEGKPKLLLIHGSGSNSASWMNDVVTYDNDFEVYCIDIPGEAGLSAESRFSLKSENFNSWLDEVITNLNLGRVSIVGQSLGAWAGLSYSIYKPENVSSLALISPSGVIEAKMGFFIRFILYSLFGKWGQNRIRKMLGEKFCLTGDAKEFFMLTLEHFNFRVEKPKLFNDEELKSLAIPIFYIGGLNDPLLDTRRTAERLKSLVVDYRVVLDDSSHILVNNASVISGFIKSIG